MSPKASRIAGLRRRIPRRLRQHWKIPVALIVFVTVMATAFGGWKIRPFITGDTADDPTSLPLVLDFSRNHAGRAYQGLTRLSIRPGSPVVNEAAALSITAATGQPSQAYSYVRYTLNGSPTATKLLLENPDADWASHHFDSDGYLYKADASSRLEYIGDDQSDYADQFKQVNSRDSGNLQPVIDLARFLDEASDEEFDSRLGDYVDVPALARYLATQNLIGNSDDMAGPGQNYYLWYDLADRKFTVVSWDLNLAFGSGTSAGPLDDTSMGGGRPPGMTAAADSEVAAPEGGDSDGPAGLGPPPGMTAGDRPDRTASGAAAEENRPRENDPEQDRGRMGGNLLKSRFLASEAYRAEYLAAYWELYEQIYGDGAWPSRSSTISPPRSRCPTTSTRPGAARPSIPCASGSAPGRRRWHRSSPSTSPDQPHL